MRKSVNREDSVVVCVAFPVLDIDLKRKRAKGKGGQREQLNFADAAQDEF